MGLKMNVCQYRVFDDLAFFFARRERRGQVLLRFVSPFAISFISKDVLSF